MRAHSLQNVSHQTFSQRQIRTSQWCTASFTHADLEFSLLRGSKPQLLRSWAYLLLHNLPQIVLHVYALTIQFHNAGKEFSKARIYTVGLKTAGLQCTCTTNINAQAVTHQRCLFFLFLFFYTSATFEIYFLFAEICSLLFLSYQTFCHSLWRCEVKNNFQGHLGAEGTTAAFRLIQK